MASDDDDMMGVNINNSQYNDALLRQNTFNALHNRDIEDDGEYERVTRQGKKQKTNHNEEPKASQPKNPTSSPPLVILHSNVVQLKSELKQLSITDYSMKMTSEGTRIFIRTRPDYEKAKKFFIDQKKPFFTHALKEDQLSKFVLSGLHKMPTDEIKGEIRAGSITPAMVKEMAIKKKRHDNHTLYIVYFFKRDKVRLADLQAQKTIGYMRVQWSHYQNKRTGPSQCSKCLRFGHGTANCHAEARCIRCAQTHASKDCPLIQVEGGGEPLKMVAKDLLKCVHCGFQHTANYQGCSKRQEFIRARETATRNSKEGSKQRQPSRPSNNFSFQPALQLNDLNFPPIGQSQGTQPAWTRSPTQRTSPRDRTPQVNVPINEINSELFNSTQLFTIFSEMTSKLAAANSKQDQIAALMQIALKYIAPLHV
jgi:hypothetical protein